MGRDVRIGVRDVRRAEMAMSAVMDLVESRMNEVRIDDENRGWWLMRRRD